MDSTTLVSRERVELAAQLLAQSRADGLQPLGAVWAQVESDGQPYLYIITPNVDSEGPIAAYLRLGRTLRVFQRGVSDPYSRLDPYEVKLIRPSDPLASKVLEAYRDFPDEQPTLLYGLPPDSLRPAYVYPAKMFDTPATSSPSA